MTVERDAKSGWWDVRVFLALLVAALIGSAAIFPYAIRLTGTDLAALGANRWLAWVASTVQTTILAALAILVGMRLGPAVNLGPRLLRGYFESEAQTPTQLRKIAPLAVALGALAAILIVVLDVTLFSQAFAAVEQAGSIRPPAWMGFLASFYGGIVEEILLRLGLMTLLVWLLTRLPWIDRARGWPMWVGIVGAALLFGLGHLPATAAITPLTSLLVGRALLLNGIPGLIFGWLYARDGLLSAIIAHFSADIVLHVVVPLIGGIG